MSKPTPPRVQREARLTWVPLAQMRISPLTQRDLNTARVDKLAANFDPERVGALTVNERDGNYYIIDGQHRAEAMRAIGWADQQVQCWTYHGLTEEEEAEAFLKLNDVLSVGSYAKFRIAVQAGRGVECDIDRIVRAQDLKISQDDDGISAVGTLRRVYTRAGAGVLARSLGLIRDAYGVSGCNATTIDGIGLLCQRYNGELDVPLAVDRLSAVHGGVNGLLGRAETIRLRTGNAKAHCVAAAAVDIINAGRRARKLPSWWKDNE